MKISVALCTYNGQKYLLEQLNSIAAQTRLPDELIVCDDVSLDDTWNILASFANSAPFATTLTRNSKNRGAIRNFELAVSQCAGDIVFLSDQDDVWLPDKVETMTAPFENHPATTMVFSNAELVDSNLMPLPHSLWTYAGLTGKSVRRFHDDPFAFLLTDHNVVTGATAAFSRYAVQTSLPFPETIAIFHDGWLALVAAAIGPVVIVDQQLVKYRQHEDQQLGVRQLTPNFGMSDYEKHLNQLTDLNNKVGSQLSEVHADLLNQYIRHLNVRLTLPKARSARSGRIAEEIFSGRYARFSSGLRSAGKDFFRK
jgi:glycosyltransferase involved in cell wall biosynthesis